jgi:hypothetical protein
MPPVSLYPLFTTIQAVGPEARPGLPPIFFAINSSNWTYWTNWTYNQRSGLDFLDNISIINIRNRAAWLFAMAGITRANTGEEG